MEVDLQKQSSHSLTGVGSGETEEGKRIQQMESTFHWILLQNDKNNYFLMFRNEEIIDGVS